ncbi:CRISPR-associated helicase/endonuclease Cas3 [Achromobacter sp. AONIH1]|uniref:CRISPR-associated helicase/endonuclease Cas3 n=1 Tax=Achromobacter sp. AONIH1 TaxID=1758194 RepID=UPI000CD0A58F|nr:CRISPR-associated helicase/endonuclease Cas3 [Achromobacter sp. AONIH1]AUT44739.1 CRISPR-associated helicase/endonuclease Cas3 [Achromobacter sp. AONIH1]
MTAVLYFAHSTADASQADWQSLPDHLKGVGALAKEYADVFGGGACAEVQGWLHDLGKYTEAFQKRLKGAAQRVDHSTWGARIAVQQYPRYGHLLAYGIAGHHAGLANGDGDGERTSLRQRLDPAFELPLLDSAWKQDITLPVAQALPLPPLKVHSRERANFQLAFLSRMLFSCLVDADFLDTERFYLRTEGRPDHRNADDSPPDLAQLRAQLNLHLAGLPRNGGVNPIRAWILQHVCAQAELEPGLFSLTVPTGGGKTLASLAFALDHAIRHGLRRVIFVIPFTSIVEQNAAVFRKALGPLGEKAVLEHHSAFVQPEPPSGDPERYQAQKKLQLAMENWDAPIVVTTAVQFFESLFAAKPSQCRKLHRIAGSVVVLDEAQTMPLKLLRPCVAAIDELARNYRASVVLCTATQPALTAPAFEGGLAEVRELAPDPEQLFKQLERVRVRHLGALDDEALAEHMRSRDQVLCIVNNRRHARAVYQAMADLPGARHLTTLMCARHRSEVLAEVRQLLKDGKPCRLVSTSLIEAGVDVDFPTVLRAEAGLDSIAQAAGRCNREGRSERESSEVLVFLPENPDWAPPPELRQYAQSAREVLRQFEADPLCPQAIERYFSLLYWQKGGQALDRASLLKRLAESRLDSLPMEVLAAEFRMIDSVQLPIIVSYDDEANAALKALEFADGSVGLSRRLQPYLVQLPRNGFDALYKAGAIAPVNPKKWGEQFMQLVHHGLYDPRYGVNFDEPALIQANQLCW